MLGWVGVKYHKEILLLQMVFTIECEAHYCDTEVYLGWIHTTAVVYTANIMRNIC